MKPHDDGQRSIVPTVTVVGCACDILETWREDVEVEAVLLAENEEVLLREDDVALYAGRALAAETGEAAAAVLHSIPTLGFFWQRKPGNDQAKVRTREKLLFERNYRNSPMGGFA